MGRLSEDAMDDIIDVLALQLRAGDNVSIGGDFLAAILTLLDPECPIREEDWSHPVIARVKAKFESLALPDEHWMLWWGAVGERPQQMFTAETEEGARERMVSLLEKRLARDCGTEEEVADLEAKVETIRTQPSRLVRWTDPFHRIEHDYQIASCRCPDSDPSRCMTYKRARRGEYEVPEEVAS